MLDEETTPTRANTITVERILQILLRRVSAIILVMVVIHVLFGSVLALQLDNSARQARAHTERGTPPLIRGSRILPGPDGG